MHAFGDVIVLVLDADDGGRSDAFLDPLNHGGEDVVLRIEGQRPRLRNATKRVRCLPALDASSVQGNRRDPHTAHSTTMHQPCQLDINQ